MSDRMDYSIVIPVYNGSGSVEKLFDRLNSVFGNIGKTWQVIFVDDNSIDNSWEILKKLKKENSFVKIIRLNKNYGQHNAVLCGFEYCDGKFVISMDDDLQHPPEEIPKLIKRINEGYDVVIASFKVKKHGIFKNLASSLFHRFNMWMLEVPRNLKYTNFVIYRGEVLGIFSSRTSFVYIPAFIFKSLPHEKITTTDVVHDKREVGRSNYNLIKLFRYSSNLWINHSSLPLFTLAFFGFLVSVLSIGFGLSIILQKFLDPGYGVEGWNSLMVATTLLGGAILMSMGIIGEYLRRILSVVSKDPQYIIREEDL